MMLQVSGYNVLIIEMKCSPKAFSASSEKKTHKGLDENLQSQEYEGVDAYCQMHCAP